MPAEKIPKRIATPYDAHLEFISWIIADSVRIAKGERIGDETNAVEFLRSDRCRRWLDHLKMPHDILDSVIK